MLESNWAGVRPHREMAVASELESLSWCLTDELRVGAGAGAGGGKPHRGRSTSSFNDSWCMQ